LAAFGDQPVHGFVFARRRASERNRKQRSHRQDRKHDDDDYEQRLLRGRRFPPAPDRVSVRQVPDGCASLL